MRPKRCNACERQWFGSGNACPGCGEVRHSRSAAREQRNPYVKNVLWVAAALTLLIVLLKIA